MRVFLDKYPFFGVYHGQIPAQQEQMYHHGIKLEQILNSVFNFAYHFLRSVHI